MAGGRGVRHHWPQSYTLPASLENTVWFTLLKMNAWFLLVSSQRREDGADTIFGLIEGMRREMEVEAAARRSKCDEGIFYDRDWPGWVPEPRGPPPAGP